ncbi:MAG: acyltransferase [Proteobacteria bacterium]|nr:MAG: acyltransferase [Pseudomonadota bacterium]
MRKLLARAFLRATGWKPEGAPPDRHRFVLIAAPHTSNWDLFYLLALAEHYDLHISFMMKHSVFRGPLGPLFKSLGGIPIYRHTRGDLVKQMVENFTARDLFVLVVPSEGTRSRVEFWKSGFYHIAREARVPIVCGYLDYARRRGGFGPALMPSGNVRDDMDAIRDFYADKTGRHPDRFAEPRLREETPAS